MLHGNIKALEGTDVEAHRLHGINVSQVTIPVLDLATRRASAACWQNATNWDQLHLHLEIYALDQSEQLAQRAGGSHCSLY